MPTVDPFERNADRYDDWFRRHPAVYGAEVAALDRFVPDGSRGLEVGVGTGRFAVPLGVEYGVDPSPAMLARAAERGVRPVGGVAESLPFADESVDVVLLVTTICFVDDVGKALAEARRVLRSGGRVVLGYVDEESPLGREYRDEQADNPFYRDATFRSTGDLLAALDAAGFGEPSFVQTVFGPLDSVDADEPVRVGHGEGSFVVLAASPEN